MFGEIAFGMPSLVETEDLEADLSLCFDLGLGGAAVLLKLSELLNIRYS